MSAAPIPQARPSAAPALRFATWNIQSGRRGLPGICALLREVDADLVALQEVEHRTALSGGVAQAEVIAREARYPHVRFLPALRRDGGLYGLALLARAPLSDVEIDPLPVAPGLEPRILGSALLHHPLGTLSVHVSHLTHRFGNRRPRAAQARAIAQKLAFRDLPRLLLGDFNDLARSPMHRILTDQLHDVFAAVGEGRGGTHSLGALLPAVRIDFAFACPRLRPLWARVVRTRASDHHLLAGELGLAPEPAARAAP